MSTSIHEGEAVVHQIVSAGATPLGQLNPKKKIFETIQPGFYSTFFSHVSLMLILIFRIYDPGYEGSRLDKSGDEECAQVAHASWFPYHTHPCGCLAFLECWS